jgi:predicted FMN-binding regulatory protein PaiB
MIMDSIVALAIAVVVISSVAWVSQYRKIRDRIRLKKALRAQAETEKVPQ